MSMPHKCKCGICGGEMGWLGMPRVDYNDPKLTAAAAPDVSGVEYWDTCSICLAFHKVGAPCPTPTVPQGTEP